MRLTPVPRGRDVPWGGDGERKKKERDKEEEESVAARSIIFLPQSLLSFSFLSLLVCASPAAERQRQKLRKVDPIPLYSLWRGGPTSVEVISKLGDEAWHKGLYTTIRLPGEITGQKLKKGKLPSKNMLYVQYVCQCAKCS